MNNEKFDVKQHTELTNEWKKNKVKQNKMVQSTNKTKLNCKPVKRSAFFTFENVTKRKKRD